MKVGDLVRFRPDLKWLNHHNKANVGILIEFKTLIPLGNRWVNVYWPGINDGLLGVYMIKELEVISESR